MVCNTTSYACVHGCKVREYTFMPEEPKKEKHYVKNLSVHLDKEIANGLKKYPEVNWSVVAREAIRKYLVYRDSLPKAF